MMAYFKMATSNNPWVRDDTRSTQHWVALGGLRAFVQRNELTKVVLTCVLLLLPFSVSSQSTHVVLCI